MPIYFRFLGLLVKSDLLKKAEWVLCVMIVYYYTAGKTW